MTGLLGAVVPALPLAATALVAAVAEPSPSPESPESPESPALESLEQARILANDNPKEFAEQLAEAIAAVEAEPALLDDEAAQSERQRALLTLARAQLKAGRETEAASAMDRALAMSLGAEVPAADFGPSLQDFHAARVEALGSFGELVVSCPDGCVAIVAHRAAAPGRYSLPPGDYAVRLGPDLRAAAAAQSQRVTLESGGEATLAWTPPPPPVASPDTLAQDAGPPERDADAHARMLPRWAEITGLAVGLGAIGAGAALLAIDGNCPGGEDPGDADACPDVYETTGAGAAVLAAGGALAVSAGVLLGVDEVRTRDGKKQAVLILGYSGRF